MFDLQIDISKEYVKINFGNTKQTYVYMNKNL